MVATVQCFELIGFYMHHSVELSAFLFLRFIAVAFECIDNQQQLINETVSAISADLR